jgi:hypothetical protein
LLRFILSASAGSDGFDSQTKTVGVELPIVIQVELRRRLTGALGVRARWQMTSSDTDSLSFSSLVNSVTVSATTSGGLAGNGVDCMDVALSGLAR